MNKSESGSQVFAQHLRPGSKVYGGTVTNRPVPVSTPRGLIVEIIVDRGENALPRFDVHYPLALAIVTTD